MNLSEIQKLLIQLLKKMNLEKDAIIIIILMLKTEEQQVELARYIKLNHNATQDSIIAETQRISQMKKQEEEKKNKMVDSKEN